jgi:hypothetical protein
MTPKNAHRSINLSGDRGVRRDSLMMRKVVSAKFSFILAGCPALDTWKNTKFTHTSA